MALDFLRSQFTTIPVPKSDFTGQTVIVTGANVGLGLEAARHLARLNAAKVILGVRTVSKGEAAANDIVQSCGVPSERIDVWPVNMADNESIKAFAKRANSLERLDAVVLNAGVMTYQWSTTDDGRETTIAVNTVSTLLLACLLLPKLKASAQRTGLRGRLAIVGSDRMDLLDLSELDISGSILSKLSNQAEFRSSQRYGISKILVYYSVAYLAERYPVEKTNILLTVLTPGLCRSELFRDEGMYIVKAIVGATLPLLARSTEVGARTLVHGVTPDVTSEAHGRFLRDVKVWPDSSNITSAQGQRVAKKWNEELFAHLEKLAPGCTKL